MRGTDFFSIPSFSLPDFVPALASRLPQWPYAVALTAAMNAALRIGVVPKEDLEALEGKTFLIDILDAGARVCFTFGNGIFHPSFASPERADLVFRAGLSAFLQLAVRQEDPDTLFFKRELSVEGDTELGLIVKNTLDAIEWPSLFSAIAARPILKFHS
ncbi:MAG: SCP2 sterol-binding domain-containing protein [Candidatus Accumulibacter sp.]|jgi:predicted lipid carrier protein YhbT|nr:SCP2 sterol-binding domain-containing protein [Accumulibacter sp.]